MPTLVFYRQARVDGGIRTGIDVNGDSVWQSFEPGNGDPDPALLWYVDLRCTGDTLPTDPEGVRRWFGDGGSAIKAAFRELADKLRVGFDDELWPYQFAVPTAAGEPSMKIVCSAIRGLEPGTLGKVLQETGENWERLLEQLAPAEALA